MTNSFEALLSLKRKRAKPEATPVSLPDHADSISQETTEKSSKKSRKSRANGDGSETKTSSRKSSPKKSQVSPDQSAQAGPPKRDGPVDEKCLSTFVPSSKNTYTTINTRLSLLKLKTGERIVFQGTCMVAIVSGCVSCYGHVLNSSTLGMRNEWHEFYSPRTSPLLEIRGLSPTNNENARISRGIQNEQLDEMVKQELQKLKWKLSSQCSVIAVANTSNTNPLRLERIIPNLFTLRHAVPSELKMVDNFHIITTPTPNLTVLNDVDIPTTLFEESQESTTPLPKKILVVGPKNSGKSTFLRFLVNKLLNHYPKVLYLDSDVGQPEFTPPGIVSLHKISSPMFGPPWTHLYTNTLSSINIGATTPKHDPDYYVQSLVRLLDVASMNSTDEDNQQIPLLINTHGWIKGIGYDLLKHFIIISRPDVIVRCSDSGTVMDLTDIRDEILKDCQMIDFTSPISSNGSKLQPADNRKLSLLSYFLRPPCTTPEQPSPPIYSPLPLTCIPSYKVLLSSVYIHFSGSSVAPSETLVALNNSIVGLCCASGLPPLTTSQMTTSPTPTPNDTLTPVATQRIPPLRLLPPSTPIPPHHCVGLGIVRSITPPDLAAETPGMLHIITPVPHAQLLTVNMLVSHSVSLGGLEIPPELVVEGLEGKKVPYTGWRANEGVASGIKKVRRNLCRRKNL